MTEDERIEAALANYDLGTVQKIDHHSGTAAKTWRVATDRGSWLLRTRGSRTSSDGLIAFDHGLRAHLVNNGIPTAEPVRTRAGEGFARVGRHAMEVYALHSGHTIGHADLLQVGAAARMLAAFHRAGADYLADPPPVAQYRTLGLDTASVRMESPELLALLYDRLSQEAGTRFAKAQSVANRWLARLQKELPDGVYYQLPQTMTHGDFTLANLLFSDVGSVCGVFDFDWSRRGPRVRDVADGMFFVAGQRRTPLMAANIWSLTEAVELSTDRCAAWLESYQQSNPLSPAEVAAIPLALAARWLSVRLEGTAKVPPEDRLRFTFGNLAEPLEWLGGQGGF